MSVWEALFAQIVRGFLWFKAWRDPDLFFRLIGVVAIAVAIWALWQDVT